MQRSRRRYRRPGRRRLGYIRPGNINFRRLIPALFFLCIGILSLSLLINYAVNSVKRKNENDRLAREYAEAFAAEPTPDVNVSTPEPIATLQPEPEIRIPAKFRSLTGEVPRKARSLYKQNKDLVGWLYIKDIVSLPVVYRDNEYYLTHAFDGKQDSGGTLFLDEKHPLTESAQHLVIHGHNMHDSSMFGILRSYEKAGIVKSHAFARFSTLFEPENYVIFAVMRVKPDVNSSRYFNYIGRPSFDNADEFTSFTDEIKRRSMFDIPVDVQPTDALLTLATCIDDDRLAVFFRRVRDDETVEQLQAQVDMMQ